MSSSGSDIKELPSSDARGSDPVDDDVTARDREAVVPVAVGKGRVTLQAGASEPTPAATDDATPYHPDEEICTYPYAMGDAWSGALSGRVRYRSPVSGSEHDDRQPVSRVQYANDGGEYDMEGSSDSSVEELQEAMRTAKQYLKKTCRLAAKTIDTLGAYHRSATKALRCLDKLEKPARRRRRKISKSSKSMESEVNVPSRPPPSLDGDRRDDDDDDYDDDDDDDDDWAAISKGGPEPLQM